MRSPVLLLLVMLAAASLRAQPTLPLHGDLFRPVFQVAGEYVNDHCLYRADDRWHLYFIQSKSSIVWGSATSEITIGHASSTDLMTWELHAPALTIGPLGALDAGHVYAPTVFRHNGRYHMIYTGTEKSFHAGEHLLAATSTDLFTWTRTSPAPVFEPDSSWASWYPAGYGGGRGGPRSCRDPHMFYDSESLRWICYYVTRLKGDPARPSEDDEFSAVAAMSTTDLVSWVDHGPVLTRRTVGDDVYTWGHPESPCVVRIDNRYYLFWKSGAGIRYVISDRPLDFDDRNEYLLTSAHASEVFEWNDRWYITSCSRDVNDIMHGTTDRTRGLFLAGLVWNGRHPTVVALPHPEGAVAE